MIVKTTIPEILHALNIKKIWNFYNFYFFIHIYTYICIIWDSRHENFAASYSGKRNVQRIRFAVKFHRKNRSCNKMERPRERSFVPAFKIDLKLTESSAIASRPTSYSHRAGFLGERKKKAEVALYWAHAKRRSTSIPDLKIGSEIGFARLRGKFLSFARCIPIVHLAVSAASLIWEN